MTQSPRIAAVVVTHNRRAQLMQTVERLLTEAVDHLIVVDNASGDDTLDCLAGVDDARLTVVALPDNRGGAGGFAAGIGQAVAQFDPDWVLVMDDDARPEPGALARFRGMALEGVGAVAAAVYTKDGGICDMNRPAVNPFWHRKAFLGTLLGGGRMGFHLADAAFEATEPMAIDVASFVGLFLHRDAIGATGLPDARFFIYGDDVMYSLSMRRAGVNLIFAPALRFEHDFKTFAGTSHAFKPLWKTYYHHRNLLFVYHSAAGVLFWPALVLILPKWLMKVRHYGADRGLYLRLLGVAIGDAMRRKLNRSHAEVVAMSERGTD